MKKMFRSFAILITMALVVACGGSDSPEPVVKGIYSAMEKGDSKKMLSYMDTSGASKEELALIEGKFDMMLGLAASEMKAQGGIKKVTIDRIDYSEDKQSASVHHTIELGDGSSNNDVFELKKVNGKWKVEM